MISFCVIENSGTHLHAKIEAIQKRVNFINEQRIEHAMSTMKPIYRYVYLMLPVFLHYHHPRFPGYQAYTTAPHGIWRFQPNKVQCHYMEKLCTPKPRPIKTNDTITDAIIGIYSMGSTGTIGQGLNSDLDIWICHRTDLTITQLKSLKEKCQLIEQWARALTVEINLFLVDENRFRANKSGKLDQDDCGSTQHILLLEEFYRSHVRLAGKMLLWSLVPIEQEPFYDTYAEMLFSKAYLNKEEWLDFGGLATLSAEEYFGAMLWQLYKSIDSPYKAVLKTILLESYIWQYPTIILLAMQIKQQWHRPIMEDLLLVTDPYYCMLMRATDYLIAIKDDDRLALIRCCFYFKVTDRPSITLQKRDWRYNTMKRLIESWQWSDEKVDFLNQRINWKINEVKNAHEQLLMTMMQSYRNLIRFARQNHLSMRATPQDIGILTRKLYAAYEVLPGKITLINPAISSDLSEEHLTFIYVDNESVNSKGWYLYNHAPALNDIISHRPIEHHRHINKLLAWSYFNGLLTANTKLHIRSQRAADVVKIQQLSQDIRQHFRVKRETATPQALNNPCAIRQLAIMINLANDPTELLDPKEINIKLNDIDILNFGKWQRSLIASVDLLYYNSWNEIRTLHFSGKLSLLDALKTILSKMHQEALPPKAINVFCYSHYLSKHIAERVEILVHQMLAYRLSSSHYEQGRFKSIKIAGQTWGIFFERLSVSTQKLENAIEFYGAISSNKIRDKAIPVGLEQVYLPRAIDGFASKGIVQFFFEDSTGDFTIYILDQFNQIEVYWHCQGKKEDFIKNISRYYASLNDWSDNSQPLNFNLPQFYQIIQQEGQQQVVPFIFHNEKIVTEPMGSDEQWAKVSTTH